MATKSKKNPAPFNNGRKADIDAKCRAKAATMPSFTVVASDNFSQEMLRVWIELARANNVNPEKIAAAEQTLRDIINYRVSNPLACKIPD